MGASTGKGKEKKLSKYQKRKQRDRKKIYSTWLIQGSIIGGGSTGRNS